VRRAAPGSGEVPHHSCAGRAERAASMATGPSGTRWSTRPSGRVVEKNPQQDGQEKVYHDAEAHISPQHILRVTRGGSDARG
jgi:hypothetical protein